MSTSRYRDVDWYAVPQYYDIIFDADTKLEGDFLEAVHRRHGTGPGRRVLEPACGSGRLLAALARRGHRVTGFDASPAMLSYAARRMRRRGLAAHLSHQRMESFHYGGRFDLAFNLVSTFKYLLTEADAEAHLRCVAASLRRGGLYVLGFHLTDYDHQRCQRERWTGRRGGVQVTCNIQSWPPDRRRRRERVRSRLVIERDGGVLRWQSAWWFRTYGAAQFRRLLARVPDLSHLATYDFSYDLNAARRLDDKQCDAVVVLRREDGR